MPEQYSEELEDILSRQRDWSEEEYLVLTDHRNRLVEYTDGVVEPLPFPTATHQHILGNLFIAFSSFFDARGGEVLFAALRVRIRPRKFRTPDLLILFDATDSRGQNRYWLGADLVLEVVGEDNPERDLIDKRIDYAEGSIPEYWIVDPESETVTVLRLQDGAYAEVGRYRRGESARSVIVPEFSISINGIFDAAK